VSDPETSATGTDSDALLQRLVQIEMAKVAQRYLRAMSIVFVVFYVLRGVSSLLTYNEDLAAVLGWPALATAAYGALILDAANRFKIRRYLLDLAFFGYGLRAVFNRARDAACSGRSISQTGLPLVYMPLLYAGNSVQVFR